MNRHKKQKALGFSLVELAISLTIIGMIAASAISVAVNSDDYSKKIETNAKLDRIEEALEAFVALNYRLPCPADGTDLITDANFGLEGTPTSTDCPNANFSRTVGISTTESGVVPVRSLQLPDDFMFDGWGRRISYVVELNMANNETTNPSCSANKCFKNVSDEVGNYAGFIKVRLYNASFNVILVVFSHGPNGHGAFTKYGGATRINGFPVGSPYRASSSAEKDNASFDEDGVAYATYGRDFYLVLNGLIDGTNYYDDIVRFKTKRQLVRGAGAMFYETFCDTSTAIIEAPGTNDCTGATSEEDCEAFAAEIYERCLK